MISYNLMAMVSVNKIGQYMANNDKNIETTCKINQFLGKNEEELEKWRQK